ASSCSAPRCCSPRSACCPGASGCSRSCPPSPSRSARVTCCPRCATCSRRSSEKDLISMSSTNGKAGRPSDGKVHVAFVGVGNCASSLIQGVEYYKNAPEHEDVPGLMHVNLGGYHVRDVEFVAAIDIDKDKVGKDLSEAIFRGQNNTVKFCDVPKSGVKVVRGMTHEVHGKYHYQIHAKQ